MGGVFGSLFGGQKDARQTNTTTTTQTDSSKNLGDGATLLESGAMLTVNDVSADVANAALDANYKVADVAIKESSGVAGSALTLAALNSADAYKFATEVTDRNLEAISSQNRNTTLAAQDAVSYGRQLAELGYSAQVDARKSETNALVDSLGKYGVWALVAIGVGAGVVVWAKRKA